MLYMIYKVCGDNGDPLTIIDNLTSTSVTEALSANQGRILKVTLDTKLSDRKTGAKITITM